MMPEMQHGQTRGQLTDRIAELEAQVDAGYETGWHALRQERDELKAAYKHTVEDNEDLVRVLDAVKWQPIETAPKDGSLVDMWHKNGFRVVETWWTDDKCWACVMDDSDFTHWMPLPEPPKAIGEQEQGDGL